MTVGSVALQRETDRNVCLGRQTGTLAMLGSSRGVTRGSLVVCEVKLEACSGRVDGLIKALEPWLWPQCSATLADTPCHLARTAA